MLLNLRLCWYKREGLPRNEGRGIVIWGILIEIRSSLNAADAQMRLMNRVGAAMVLPVWVDT